MDSLTISLISIAVIIVIVLFLRKNNSMLGKKGKDGSEIIASRFKKYKSIKEIPKIKDNLGNKTIVAYFSHSQCSGCKVLTPEFDKLIEQSNAKVVYTKINPVEDNIDFMSIGVMFVPAILIFDKDGDLSKNIIGLIQGSAERVVEEISKAINV